MKPKGKPGDGRSSGDMKLGRDAGTEENGPKKTKTKDTRGQDKRVR